MRNQNSHSVYETSPFFWRGHQYLWGGGVAFHPIHLSSVAAPECDEAFLGNLPCGGGGYLLPGRNEAIGAFLGALWWIIRRAADLSGCEPQWPCHGLLTLERKKKWLGLAIGIVAHLGGP